MFDDKFGSPQIDPIDLNTHTFSRFHNIRRIKFDVPRGIVSDLRERYLMERLPGKEIYNIFRYNPKSGVISYLYRYDNPQDAIDTLGRLNGNMNIEEIRGEVKKAFYQFINNEDKSNIDEFIFSLMSIVTICNDQYFQNLVDTHNIYVDNLAQEHTKAKYFTKWELFEQYKCLNPLAEKFEKCCDLIISIYYEENQKKLKDYPDLEQFADSIFDIFDIDQS